MTAISIAETVDVLTQELLATLRHRCVGVYASFASVFDRLSQLSTLLLDRGDLNKLLAGDEAIVMLLRQLSRASSLQSKSEGKISLQVLVQAPARSKLALLMHQRVDDLVKVYLSVSQDSLGDISNDATWKSKWEKDCSDQRQYYQKLLETGAFECDSEELSGSDKEELVRSLKRLLQEQFIENKMLHQVLAVLESHGDELSPKEEPPTGDSGEDKDSFSWQESLALPQWDWQSFEQQSLAARPPMKQKEMIPSHEVSFQPTWLLDDEPRDLNESLSSSLFQGSWLDTTVDIQLADQSSNTGENDEQVAKISAIRRGCGLA